MDIFADIAHSGVSYRDYTQRTFIGLYTTTNDYTMWNWTDGSPADYTMWDLSANQPEPVQKKCISLLSDPDYGISAGYWGNVNCDINLRNYVCKKWPVLVNVV